MNLDISNEDFTTGLPLTCIFGSSDNIRQAFKKKQCLFWLLAWAFIDNCLNTPVCDTAVVLDKYLCFHRYLQAYYEKPCTNPDHNVCATFADGYLFEQQIDLTRLDIRCSP